MLNKFSGLLAKGKRISTDFLLRITSSALTTFSTQIVLLPLLAMIFDAEEYGFILTLTSIKNIIAGTLGNSLYSTRIVIDSEYKERRLIGDFNRLIAGAAVLSILIMGGIMMTMDQVSPVVAILMLPVTVIYTLNSYLKVWYPVTLQYKKALLHSIVVSVGVIIGALIVYLTKLWPLAYLASALTGFLFIIKNTEILKEGFGRTPLFSKTFGKWGVFIITTLLVNVVTYLDRLVLYPLLGADAVSTFSTASYFGKALSVLAMPVANVILSYYAQHGFKMTRKRFWTVNGTCFVLLFVFAAFSLLLGIPVTGLLFPSLIEAAKPFVFIANMSSAIAAIVLIVQTATMKYAKTYWQMVVQIVFLAVYFVLGMLLIQPYGLMGFCVASLLANTTRIALQIIIGHCALGDRNEAAD